MVSKAAGKHYLGEVIGTSLVLLGLLITVSLVTYNATDPTFSTITSTPDVHNAVGRIGAHFSDFIVQIFGISSYLLPVFFIIIGIKTIRDKNDARSEKVLIGGFLLMATTLAALRVMGMEKQEEASLLLTAPYRSGGMLGQLISTFFLHYFAETGTYIIFYSLFLIGLMLAFPFSPSKTLVWSISRLKRAKMWCSKKWGRIEVKGRNRRKPLIEKQGDGRNAFGDKPGKERKTFSPPEVTAPQPRISTTPRQEVFDFNNEVQIGDYRLPPLSLLSDPPLMTGGMTQKELIAQSQILQKKLLDFGIEGRVTQVHPGPVITMFEFEPAPGVKLNRITSLSDDLALGMRALHVRIIAPLPGKAAVGIEVPNHKREAVFLKEVLSSPSFNRLGSPIRLALGKDIFGSPVSADLAKMPHLLIAGATGSGKSVGLNGMILSILFSSTPSEVKMLMIDPKMLEFSLYDGIPHLITPVIVRPKAAADALKKMVAEMQRRYELLSEKGVRNIGAYNELARESDEIVPLPYIIVFIDELADLMMVAARQVEDSIARLAQMARAAGIHLVLATQRPSVDVLTGLIKANFPARIAFNVSSKTDSRTILDANGAQQLLGKGDMLYLSAGTGKLTRIHGAYISEKEVKKVVSFIKGQSQPLYEETFSESQPTLEESSSEDRDALYEQARELVISTKQASASFIQRRMRVGYPRAARIIEMMEEDGLVGPAIGSKPREIFIRKEVVE